MTRRRGVHISEATLVAKTRVRIAKKTELMNMAIEQISKIENEMVKYIDKLAGLNGRVNTKRYESIRKKIEDFTIRRNKWVDKYTAYRQWIDSRKILIK
jgi:hypothetical protein